MKTDLRNLSYHELEDTLKGLGEPAFRAKQVFPWIQQKGVASIDEMANLPKESREKLLKDHEIGTLKKIEVQASKDGTKKFLWELHDGGHIESVLLDDEGRKTICLSTQVGCRMNCAFCATAKVKFKRNLSAGEIVSQVIEIENENGRISNLVYMGMGEPLDNYEDVIKSVKLLTHPLGKNIGQRKITISTCGLVPEILKLAKEGLQIRLALSLNATEDPSRNRLMPINKKFPLEPLRQALKDYSRLTGRRATIEYLMIKGQNDSPQDADNLLAFARGLNANINLIAFNVFEGSSLEAPDSQTMNGFRKTIESAGIEVAQRFKRGQDIDAACGQLTGKHEAKK